MYELDIRRYDSKLLKEAWIAGATKLQVPIACGVSKYTDGNWKTSTLG
jgi:hypothetical protein